MTNVQPPLPEPARPAGTNFHSMTPRKIPEFQPASFVGAGWNPCFACGQTGHRLMSYAKYWQECARDRLRDNRCPARNTAGVCPADCRRRLDFATSPFPHLELNKFRTSHFIRCGLPMPRWYHSELLVDPAHAAPPAMVSVSRGDLRWTRRPPVDASTPRPRPCRLTPNDPHRAAWRVHR